MSLTNGNGNSPLTVNGSNGNGGGPFRWLQSLWSKPRIPERDTTPFSQVALQLHYDLSGPDQRRLVMIAAPSHSELCATSAATLATCLADQLLRPVLLIDVCPRHPE